MLQRILVLKRNEKREKETKRHGNVTGSFPLLMHLTCVSSHIWVSLRETYHDTEMRICEFSTEK